jgi:sugar lactone lactonase YvrE
VLSNFVGRAIAASAAFALLAGCGGSGMRVAPPTFGTSNRASARNDSGRFAGLVFVSDLDSNAVWVCPTNFGDIRQGFLAPTKQLQGVANPVQIALDRQGTIYVANSQTDASGAGSVTEYPRGKLSPSRTLTAGLNTSTGVAVDAAGTVYVSNKFVGSIEVFPKGKSVPSGTITANLTGPDGLAVDRMGDLFIADGSANDVLKLARGTKTPQSLHLKHLSRPVGVAVDSHDNLYVSSLAGASSNVAVYASGSTTPSRAFLVPGPIYGSEGTIGEPVMLSIAPGDLLIASAFITLALVQGEWFGYTPTVDGFASGQSQPLWSVNDIGVAGSDAVFQPAK